MSRYRFIDVTELPPEIQAQVVAAIEAGTIRLVGEGASGKQYVDGQQLDSVLGLPHGRLNI